MKKVLFAVVLFVFVVLILNGLKLMASTIQPVEKKSCVGYTVIEAGKGINCHGDTVALRKKHGYYELTKTEEIKTGNLD
ncbi:MAG: hypothetical protein ACOYXT_10260 [Bacteroidota bacterium]